MKEIAIHRRKWIQGKLNYVWENCRQLKGIEQHANLTTFYGKVMLEHH